MSGYHDLAWFKRTVCIYALAAALGGALAYVLWGLVS